MYREQIRGTVRGERRREGGSVRWSYGWGWTDHAVFIKRRCSIRAIWKVSCYKKVSANMQTPPIVSHFWQFWEVTGLPAWSNTLLGKRKRTVFKSYCSAINMYNSIIVNSSNQHEQKVLRKKILTIVRVPLRADSICRWRSYDRTESSTKAT